MKKMEIKYVIFLTFIFLSLPTISADFGYNKIQKQTTGSDVTVTTLTGNLTQLGELTDVTIPSPTDGYVLTYNSTSGVWEDQSAAAVGDTNETTRFNTLVGNCSSGYYMRGVLSDGSRVCVEDQTGGGGGGNTTEEMVDAVLGQANGSIEYNDGGDEWGVNQTWFQTFGETLWAILTWDYDYSDLINTPTHLTNFTDDILWTTEFNNTFDSRDNDTTYSALSEFSNDVGFTTNSTMNKTVSCSDIVGSPDSDFCTDEFGAGGGGGNTTEEIVDAVLGQANGTITYNDVGDEWGVNQTWVNNNFVGLTEYPNLDTDSTDDFDGTFSSLTGVDSDACTSTDKVTNVTVNNGILTIVCDTDVDTDTDTTNANQTLSYNAGTDEITISSGNTIDISEVNTDGSVNLTHLSNFTDDLGHVEDNSSWNETHADTQYADISVTGDNASWNQTLADTLYIDEDIIDDNLYNASQFDETGGVLNLIVSAINDIIDNRVTQAFVEALGFYTETEVDNINTSMTNYVNANDADDVEFTTSFGGDVSGTYDNLAVTDNSHQHDLNNITNVGNLDLDSTNDHLPNSANVTCHNLDCSANVTWNGTHSIWW